LIPKEGGCVAEWRRRYPLDFVSARAGQGPLRLVVRNGVAVVVVMARPGMVEAVAHALAGLDATICPTAPGQWTLLAAIGADGAFARRVTDVVSARAHVGEQSHGRQVVRITGPATRELLARGCRLDLHARAAPPGFTAQSPVGGFACLLHVVDDAPTIDLVVAAGYARAFWHWLETHAAPFDPKVEVRDG
jgi:sarcosine oxidase subunit gamma